MFLLIITHSFVSEQCKSCVVSELVFNINSPNSGYIKAYTYNDDFSIKRIFDLLTYTDVMYRFDF